MRSLATLCFLGLLVLANAHGDHGHDHDHHDHDHGDDSEHVVTLTQANFDSTIAEKDLVLVEFYAPWCGHCKRLAPEYESAASQLWGQATLAKVDCTEQTELCSKYGVEGFPTIKLFRKDGSNSAYEKGRTASDIVKFLTKQSQPAVRAVATAAELQALKDADQIVVVGFFDDATSAGAKALAEVAATLRDDATFGQAASSVDAANAGKIVVFRKFDEPVSVFSGANDQLAQFIKSLSFPLLGLIGPENYAKYVERDLPLFWFFLDLSSETPIEGFAREVAKKHSTLSFVKLDGNRWASHAKNFGLSGKVPGLVIEDRKSGKKFVFPESQEVTLAALEEFTSKYAAGTLEATVKSQEIPAENNEPVKVVVGKSFDSIVLDSTKDVLVEFYAPWCGHCKSLEPKYTALGEEFKPTPSIVIAKVDATENDTPAQIQGFPTILFYRASDKQNPLTYDGERTQEAMSAWIKENADTLKKGAPAAGAKHDEL